MNRILFAGLLALAVAVNPAYAAKTKKNTRTTKPAKKVVTKKTLEDEAWGGPAKPKPVKTVVKKPTTKPGEGESTVKLNPTEKPVSPTVAIKPPTTPDETTKPATDPAVTAGKTAEELEKIAQGQAKKDPKAALGTYEKMLENNPNYAYAGDAYAEMYNLSVKSKADLLTQIKYAGMAGKQLEAGQSRKPVTPQQLKQYKMAEEKLINQWIEKEIQNIMNQK